MHKLRKPRGGGITKAEVAAWELTPEDLTELNLETLANHGPDREMLGQFLGRWMLICREAVREAGINPDLIERLPLIPAGIEPDSPTGYSIRVLGLLAQLDRLTQNGDALGAAGVAFRLGMLASETGMKVEWERPALSGKKRAEDLREATARHNRQVQKSSARKYEKWRELALAVWANHPTWGALKVAEAIATENESPETIRQIIRSIKPTR